MTSKKLIRVLSVLISVLMISSVSYADEKKDGSCEIVQSEYGDSSIKLYVRNIGSEKDGLLYQIGNEQVEIKAVKGIEESGEKIKTLIMLDNSLSISDKNRDKAKALIDKIIDSHLKNEEIKLSLFDEKMNDISDYSTDYEDLKNRVSEIDFTDQETYLTDALYQVFNEYYENDNVGYRRIVIISDGVDNKPIGVTQDELKECIKKDPVQIYTIGSKNKNNNEELKNMFSLSRMTSGRDYILDESDMDDIAAELKKDLADVDVVEAGLPIDLQSGGTADSQLTLADGKTVQYSVRLPFGLKEKEEPSVEPSTEKEEESEPESKPEPEPEKTTEPTTEESAEAEPEKETGGPPLIIIPIILLLAVGAYVFILINNKKKKSKESSRNDNISGNTLFDDEKTMIDVQPYYGESEETLILEDDRTSMADDEATLILEDGHYTKLVLTDINRNDKEFSCDVRGEVIIGRRSNGENSLVIDYDHSISGRHCMIHEVNSRIYVQDLHSTNSTKVNGTTIYSDTEIHTGDILTLGRIDLRVEIIP